MGKKKSGHRKQNIYVIVTLILKVNQISISIYIKLSI